MARGVSGLAGIGVGLVSGLVATKAMEPVTEKLYEMESEEDKRREKAAQPRTSYVVAAEKTASAVGLRLDEERAKQVGMLFHYALGASWGPAYVLLRHASGMHPLMAGSALGLLMFAAVDEAANWALGFTPPPQRFPIATHMRGLVGHLVYGVALAATAELLLAVVARPRRRSRFSLR